ncbi:serine hydrolase [Pirellulaceae bacterium SH449]
MKSWKSERTGTPWWSITLGLCYYLLVGATLARSSDDWHQTIDQFRSQLRSDVQADDVGGITAAVVVGNQIVWAEGFGWADREKQVPAGVETVYRIGSISKSFATIAMVQLVQSGKINLDDPISHIVPEVDQIRDRPAGSPDITWRHLVTHTSGLVREPALLGHSVGPLDQWEEKTLSAIPTTRYNRSAGESYLYSNIGFATLGVGLGRLSEKPFIDLIETDVIQRLGLKQTGFRVDPAWEAWLATGYANLRDEEGQQQISTRQPAREHTGRGYRVPNGGLYSNVGDLAKWMAAMYGEYDELLLEREWVKEMLRLQTPGDSERGYGLGFQIRHYPDGSRHVGHGGSVSGYRAQVSFDPDARVGVILLRNYDNGQTNLERTAHEFLTRLVAQRPSRQLPVGKADFRFIDWQGNSDRPLHVWTYRPQKFQVDSPIVFVMHGTLRNAETYRQPWISLADELGCLVVCPEFSTEHYGGSYSYHFGNVVSRRGEANPEEKWTFNAIEHLFDHIRERVNGSGNKYYIFGHSAGGQFVHRMVMMKPDARLALAIAANAGSYTLPDFATSFPYGLGGMDYQETRLADALAAPLVIMLGEEDTDPNDRYLPRGESAMAQGPHRFARGQRFMELAEQAAERLGISTEWQITTVPGVGHDNAKLARPAADLISEHHRRVQASR